MAGNQKDQSEGVVDGDAQVSERSPILDKVRRTIHNLNKKLSKIKDLVEKKADGKILDKYKKFLENDPPDFVSGKIRALENLRAMLPVLVAEEMAFRGLPPPPPPALPLPPPPAFSKDPPRRSVVGCTLVLSLMMGGPR